MERPARTTTRPDGTFELGVPADPHDDKRGVVPERTLTLVVTLLRDSIELYRGSGIRWPPDHIHTIEISISRADLERAGAPRTLEFLTGDKVVEYASPARVAAMHRAKGTRELLPVADAEMQIELDRIEKLITQRHFGQALLDLERVEPGVSPLQTFLRMRREALRSKACCRIATVYALEGKTDDARYFYRKALEEPRGSDATERVAAMIDQGFAARVSDRRRLIAELGEVAARRPYASPCEARHRLRATSLLNDAGLRAQVSAATFLRPSHRRGFIDGGNPPLPGVTPGWLDALDPTPETWGVTFTNEAWAHPGALTEYGGADPTSLEVYASADRRLDAATVMSVAHARLQAHAGLLALQLGVNVLGDKRRPVPLYRYAHLRERVLGMLDRLDRIERKMIDLQLSLDDYAQAKAAINNALGDSRAALAALEKRIEALMSDLVTVRSLEEEVGTVRQELKHYQEECDVEWWEIVLGVALVVVLIAVGIVIGGFVGNAPGAVAGAALGLAIALSATEALGIWAEAPVDCENVGEAEQAFSQALSEIRRGRRSLEDELETALAERDVTQAEVAALEYKLQAAIEANAARHLNAKTTAAIINTYEETRQHVLAQATALANDMETSYRFESGESWRITGDRADRLIARSYEAPEGKGYGAREKLLKDVEALEFLRLTGRTAKSTELTQVVSLRRHYPATLVAFKLGAKATFTISQSRFDDWYPGTYQHRIREVHVEVLVDGAPASVRGYLNSYGASHVRFRDPDDDVPIDGSAILVEPDADIRRLCFKRAAQLGVHDTMAFPELRSVRADARATERQTIERNAFEGLGLGSTFTIELLPDQAVDVDRITDVLVHIHVEAEFDAQLQRVLETKRFTQRTHVAQLSARKLCEQQGRPFSTEQIRFDLPSTSLPYPHRAKEIRQLALMITPRHGVTITGATEISVGLGDNSPITVETDDSGRAACGTTRHAGPSGAEILAGFAGKDPAGSWHLAIESLPPGVAGEDVGDVLMFIRYGFANI
jgi:hypothetical protein